MVGLLHRRRVTPHAAGGTIAATDRSRAPGATAVYVTIALSGMTALSAEVLWTRLLSLLFGATVYTFSLILARVPRRPRHRQQRRRRRSRAAAQRPRVALGWCQMLLCGAHRLGGVHAHAVAAVLADQPVDLRRDPWFNFQLDMVRCLWVVLPGAILWGASFPLALASVAAPGQDPARLVGGVYAANTVGAIVGSLVAEPDASVGLTRQPARAAGAHRHLRDLRR